MSLKIVFLLSFLAVSYGQKVANGTEEYHLPIVFENDGENVTGSIVIDANWRRTRAVDDTIDCYSMNEWDEDLCPDAETCTENCAIEGIDESSWSSTYGITSAENGVRLSYVTESEDSSVYGARIYVLASDDSYQVFQLKNRELSFDVDLSDLPCGLNGALYFVAMDEDGGVSEFPTNEAGARYGTGYCDAQCPHDLKFVAGKANSDGWTPSELDDYSGTGEFGACCHEMSVWEANSQAQSYTAHICSVEGYTACNGTDCGDNGDDRYKGLCDKDGCDYAVYRLGQYEFYGEGMTIDTTSPFTVITQFITDDDTDEGEVEEIRRLYQQNGQTYLNAAVNFPGLIHPYDSITEEYCTDIKRYFGDTNNFDEKGGMAELTRVLDNGLVLAMSLFDDYYAHMLWLDGTYPSDSNEPGALRGPCSEYSGYPPLIRELEPDSSVTFSNIRVGNIIAY